MSTATSKSHGGDASKRAQPCAQPSGGVENTGRRKFEQEFLIRLAATWFKCRWIFMGHRAYGGPHCLEGALLGMYDYAAEMRLVCEEVQSHVRP